MAWFRVRVNWTYSTSASANTAASNIEATLASLGYSAYPVTRPTTTSLDLVVEPLTEAQATALRAALTSNWNTGTRTAGKTSVVRRDERSG